MPLQFFSTNQLWGSPCEKGLSPCNDKNMIPTCAQSSDACDVLTINLWLYFSYMIFHGATQCLSSFSITQVWGSPCEKGLSQCTDKNMITTCAQSSAACDWLTINFSLYFSNSTYCGAMQILSSYFLTQGRSSPCDKCRSASGYGYEHDSHLCAEFWRLWLAHNSFLIVFQVLDVLWCYANLLQLFPDSSTQ